MLPWAARAVSAALSAVPSAGQAEVAADRDAAAEDLRHHLGAEEATGAEVGYAPGTYGGHQVGVTERDRQHLRRAGAGLAREPREPGCGLDRVGAVAAAAPAGAR